MFYLLEFCNVQKSARTKLVVGLSMLTCSTVLQIRWKNCKKIRIKRFVFLIETTKRLIYNNEDFYHSYLFVIIVIFYLFELPLPKIFWRAAVHFAKGFEKGYFVGKT